MEELYNELSRCFRMTTDMAPKFVPSCHRLVLLAQKREEVNVPSPKAAGNLTAYLVLAGEAHGNPDVGLNHLVFEPIFDRKPYYHLSYRICKPHRGSPLLKPLEEKFIVYEFLHPSASSVFLLEFPWK